MLGAVAHRHGGELQALAAIARQRQADQATAMLGHEIDGLGRDEFGREDQIALVLAVFLVNEDDHAAGTKLGNDLFCA